MATLDSDNWQTVTLEYLNRAAKILNEPEMILGTYGEVFKALEFLAEAGAIELIPDTTQPGVHKLRKITYGNQTS